MARGCTTGYWCIIIVGSSTVLFGGTKKTFLIKIHEIRYGFLRFLVVIIDTLRILFSAWFETAQKIFLKASETNLSPLILDDMVEFSRRPNPLRWNEHLFYVYQRIFFIQVVLFVNFFLDFQKFPLWLWMTSQLLLEVRSLLNIVVSSVVVSQKRLKWGVILYCGLHSYNAIRPSGETYSI